jgi:hypothetical protein
LNDLWKEDGKEKSYKRHKKIHPLKESETKFIGFIDPQPNEKKMHFGKQLI